MAFDEGGLNYRLRSHHGTKSLFAPPPLFVDVGRDLQWLVSRGVSERFACDFAVVLASLLKASA